MKKKILYISIKNPFSNKFSGDRERAKNTIKYLTKFYIVDLLCLEKINQKNIVWKNLNIFSFKKNFFEIINNLLFSVFHKEPFQIALFNSKKLKRFINSNISKYDFIICNTIRTAQYVPENYKGKKILDMIDLISSNYSQTFKKLSIFNPLHYVYFIEFKRMLNYEKFVSKKFERIFFVSKKDIKLAKNLIPSKKLFLFPMGTKKNSYIYKFNKNNYKILFIGNLKYLPNKDACYDFIKQTLPKLFNIDKKIKFICIGETSFLDKIRLNSKKNVLALGKIKNLKNYIHNTICALCNTEIAAGFQTKILTYMSYGIPTVASANTMVDEKIKNNQNILVYNKKNELLKKILELKNNNKLSNKISKNSFTTINSQFDWDKICKKYFKI